MKRALIVEDNPIWAELISAYCRKEKIKTQVANSPQAAMDHLSGHLPDVIVLDMLLAAETGMALLNELRSHDDLSQIPVIIFTSIDTLDFDNLAAYGVKAVLNKAQVQPEEASRVIGEAAYGK
ncbi:hypothetical protein B7Y94_01835 [Candidatus Saccharibacteria bacterium 32-49-12]|nr:MAG: hypothetical protein B7Y94_01835 [Candidatus Saccharibacteria bacterium 32-49-12]